MHKRKSVFLGVARSGKHKWVAQLVVNKVHYFGGYFDTALEAAIARDKLAYQLLGDKAKLNFPDRIAEYILTPPS